MLASRSLLDFILVFSSGVQTFNSGLSSGDLFKMCSSVVSSAVTCTATDNEGNVYTFNKKNSQSIVFGTDMENVVTRVRNCQPATVKCYVFKEQIFFDTSICPPRILSEKLSEETLKEASKKRKYFGDQNFCKPQFLWSTMFSKARLSRVLCKKTFI